MSDHQLLLIAVNLSAFAAGAQLVGLVAEIGRLVQRRRQLRRIRGQMQVEVERFVSVLQAAVAGDDQQDAPRVH